MNKKNFITLVLQDNQLKTLFSGMLISMLFLVSLVVTAGVWYL